MSELQRALSICHDLDIDGVYGPNTRNSTSWRWYFYPTGGGTCARV